MESMTVDHTQSLLRVHTTSAGAAAVCVSVAGELDVGNSRWLRAWIVDAVDRHRPAGILLDLGGLEFVDVAGVRTLYELHAAAEARGCSLTVERAHVAVRLTLDRLGLEPAFVSRDASVEAPRCV
jgi:anti-anti-sigma factor